MSATLGDATQAVGLVVPVFDDAHRLAEFGPALVAFAEAQPPGSELVIVDDGSADDPGRVVDDLAAGASAPVRILRRPHRGKGAAVRSGLAAVGAPVAAFCDVDLSTPLPHLERIIDAARRAPVLAIGSRDLPASRLLRHEGQVREALGRTYNRLLQLTVTPGVVDTQCGAKAARRDVWDEVLIHCREDGFAWDAEAVAVALARTVRVLEVPVDWRHDQRSKIRVGRDGLAMAWATGRIWRSARRAADHLAATTAEMGPNPARASADVFDDVNARQLMDADRTHWWFRSKAALVTSALARTAPPGGDGDGWLVDAGAGAGGVTAMLGRRPDRLVVVEGNATLVREASRRHGIDATQGSVDALPFAGGSVDVVSLLDVIEHLDDPVAALREAARVAGLHGRVVVNVPAHSWLWSTADEHLGHRRRYTRPTLRAELAAAGLDPVVLTHVFSWLVPPVYASRRLRRSDEPDLGLDRTSFVFDRAAMLLTRLERAVVRRVSLPIGTSVLAVAVPTAGTSGASVLGGLVDGAPGDHGGRPSGT